MSSPVYRTTAELEQQGEPHAIATVVRVDRPVSARPGDCAVVTAEGRLEGWVGGSCSEPIVLREALASLADGAPRLVRIRPARASGSTDDPAEPGVVTEITACASEGGLDIFVQPRLPAPRLAIAGSSPAARTLARLTGVLGYRITAVLDDPAERLPGADGTVSPRDLVGIGLGAEDAVVVASMSRYDEAALEAALDSGAGYVGLVASGARGAQMLAMLRASGVSDERLERVRTPAGIDLGPSGQEEIAVAVLAEIVAHRNRARAAPSEPLCPPELAVSQAVDPICGMKVAVTPTAISVERDGSVFYFCSQHCRHSFMDEPEAASS
jgi:xanthine dehydrogenase accessory factor